MQFDFWPVIKARSSHMLIIQRKAKFSDQVEMGSRCGTEPADVAGIGRNFRLD
jgi:hypothetical protein